MDGDELGQLTSFLFDRTLHESDDELRAAERPDILPPSGHAPRNRAVRKRSRKACVACNKRKVRCDVLSCAHACTNCRLDGISCTIKDSGRRRVGRQTVPVDEVPSPTTEVQEQSQLISLPPRICDPLTVASMVEVQDASPTQTCSDPFTFTQPFHTPVNWAQPSSHTDLIYSYYDFVETESWTHIAPDDCKFLEYKGCFHLPSKPVLNHLVREYFLHVHPVLPIINEKDFWESYIPRDRRAGRGKIPLFVFRAMLFVSCGFVSDSIIRQLGFPSAVEARSCMYRRAKLLYDFNTTSDPIALSQGALILTYYSSDLEPLANTSWLRLAIQYASSVNASMYDRDSLISGEERLARKRLWWCLILRDRILPLGVRRPIQITRETFDFSQPKISMEDLEPEFRCSAVYSKETKSDLAAIFLAQLDLAVELTDAISYIYPIDGYQFFDRLDSVDMQLMRSKIERYKDGLDTWNVKFRTLTRPATWPQKHKSIALYGGLTSIYYQSARAALCQYESFSIQAEGTTVHELRMKELGGALHSSVANISDTVREFVQIDVAKYLPVSAVAYLALPIVLNSLDLQTLTPKNARTEAKRHQLRLLNEAMDLCHKRYTGTVAANSAIKRTIEAACWEHNVTNVQADEQASLVHLNSDINDWFDVFLSKPTQYLRISFTIDFSFCTGRYPDTEDYLPQRLALHHQLIPNPSIPRPLVLNNESIFEAISFDSDGAVSEATKNSHLDFLDLSNLVTSDAVEQDCWSGITVDEMLDGVLGEGGRF